MGCCQIKGQKNNENQNEIVIIKGEQEEQKNTSVVQEKKIQQGKIEIQPIIQKDTNQTLPIQEKYLMLLGTAGVGKSTLFQQLELSDVPNETTSTISNYHEGKLNEYFFIDTPSFQLDDEIETREIFIKEFQEYFDNRKYISSFGIVVNFERTDLMKKKVLQVLKYLRKFKDIISIIVVNMELSDNVDEDKKHLRDSFKHMGCHRILFISKEMKQKQILEQIQEIQFIKTHIDLTDTIFEKITQSQEKRQLQDLKIRLDQRL
ncbi:unnamed protein product [Paramecium pentaurelia]|uniref:G domain-containing protein n=1 Tax=Paramecium pentaurelia TaxID=43138 RepID=A0A8S1XBZ4_9CILI|nr:unnamed protein product [Paramecium pentaurelia]